MGTKSNPIHIEVRDHYAAAAKAAATGQSACCGPESGNWGPAGYDTLEELPDAALLASLGCGNPIAVADLCPGETVLDLGSGGGIDVLLSAKRVGPTGHVYGLDMTPQMLDLARHNAAEAGATNVEFLEGQIEEIPLPDGSVDVIISNCVINLSPDKRAVFAEMLRVLRPGGRIGVSDVVTDDELTEDERRARGSFVGCIAGALPISAYRNGLAAAGFVDVSITVTNTVADGVHSAIVRATKPATVAVRAMTATDWPQVRAIYEAGIATANATFETSAPTWEDWDTSHLREHRLVAADENGTVVGWAALSPVSDRCAYAGVAENSVYVAPGQQGRGIGRALLRALIASSEHAGIWTLQTGIFPENEASVALHVHCGFRIVGRRERIGRLQGVWRDVYFLERRSPAVD